MKLEVEKATGKWDLQGEDCQLITMENSAGLKLKVHSYGPRLLEIHFPDEKGQSTSILLGYPDLKGYLKDKSFQGYMAVGPYGNRIGQGKYQQPDDSHPEVKKGDFVELTKNDGPNTLHGGPDDWGKNNWMLLDSQNTGPEAKVSLGLDVGNLKGPGEFPPPSQVILDFSLNENNEITFDYKIQANVTIPVNPTFHGYFNLNGVQSQTTVKNHVIKANYSDYLPVDNALIPTGEIASVMGSRFDFSSPVALGDNFGKQGYDDCLVFPVKTEGLVEVYSKETGIHLKMTTNQPSAQIYTGHFLGEPFLQYGAMCIEAQQLVNNIQNPEWEKDYGPAFLKAGETFHHKTVYQLGHASI